MLGAIIVIEKTRGQLNDRHELIVHRSLVEKLQPS